MELQKMRYCVAVADRRSFTAAAQALHVSQSGVSTQIARTERELGVTLFRRGGSRRVELTAGGEVVISRMRLALAAIDEVQSSADMVAKVVSGRVRLGAVAGLSWTAFLDALQAVHRQHPQVELTLREGVSGELQAAVLGGQLDLALVSWPDRPMSGLDHWVALEEQVCAVVAPEHPWAGRRSVLPADLVDQPIVCMVGGTGMRAGYDAVMSTAGLPAAVAWEVTLPTTVRTMAARGFGVGVVTASQADPPADVVTIPVLSPSARTGLGLVWRAGERPTAAVDAVLGVLRNRLGGSTGQ